MPLSGWDDDQDGQDGDDHLADHLSDPFEALSLDEDFISAAAHSEPSAAQRERARRQADLARRLADEELQRQNDDHQFQRYAPTDMPGGRKSGRSPSRATGSSWSRRLSSRRMSGGGSSSPPESSTRPTTGFMAGRFSGLLRSRLLLLGLVVVIGILALDYFTPNDGVDRSAGPAIDIPRPETWPPAVKDPSPSPLGEPGKVPAAGGKFKFLQLQDDGETPVAYDPCREIHYVTRPGGPPQGQQLIRESIAELSMATGLQFIDDGATDEGPSKDRDPYQPDRYGERWAPVLIVWSDPVESPQLGKVDPASPLTSAAGFAGSQAVAPPVPAGEPQTLVYVTGSVVLDGPDFTQMLAAPSGLEQARGVIVHELGHLAGLDHVDDPTQIMFPTVNEARTYQAGDLRGLAELGRGRCMPDV
ncbi:MAG: matrixin family metalloprotease [Microthrixaceae bacterium]